MDGISLDVDVNDTVNYVSRENLYFESNNVLARIKSTGSSNDSLLISSHYDSTSVSHGATDDGVAVAVMLETIHALVKRSSNLLHDVVFLFNNAEEIGLLGGTSFTQTADFQTVKAFINLEGTGDAGASRSMIFRTNSHSLVTAYAQGAFFPHASVLFSDLMQFVHSDTDYRPYATLGNLPGLDIAFYAKRYLYHTPRYLLFSLANYFKG